ncbi:SRPBCC family protein [Oxynema sp. CENA135]|uniref:SRPBCC family protein n=1 Tax=Oxynema sp. CENA135 TaxID=984206 RepID=UPI00190DF1A0|nr:SRPBCC family protein [Oxynema sp. CENA135]MBK4728452.1 SRPBCC family protein [Oxynema sp. CENA135]
MSTKFTRKGLKVAMNYTRPLRTALLANAVFSAVCGLLMLVEPVFVEKLLGIQAGLLLRSLGFGLLLFAVDLVCQATRPRLATWRALYASVADVLWVISSVVGLLLFSDWLSPMGVGVVAIVAGVVLALGCWQIWGIDRAHRAKNPALYRHCLIVGTEAPAAALWDAIARMGDIQNYMPSLVSSEILEGKSPGVGVLRRCTDKSGRCWREKCIEFEPGQSLTMRFVAEAPDFPFPASTMLGGWKVMSVGTGSEVMVWWELAPKPRFLAPILLPILAFGADRDFVEVIRLMADDTIPRKDNKTRLALRLC